MNERERFARLCYETDTRTKGKWETVTTMSTMGARSAVAAAYAQADALVAAGFEDVSVSRANAADNARAEAVANRYLLESLPLLNGETPEIEYADLLPVIESVQRRFATDGLILHVFMAIQNEFDDGRRCAICTRTPKQNATLGYNCEYEC